MGHQNRSRSLSPPSSPSPDSIPSGKAPGVLRTKVASKRLPRFRGQTRVRSSFSFRQLGRPLQDGERQILTVLAREYVSTLLVLSTPPITPEIGGKSGDL